MEKGKKWEELSSQTKLDLLRHWFTYYGGLIITFDEIEKFDKLAQTYPDEIFDSIVTSYLATENHTIQSNLLIMSMRRGLVAELFKSIIRYKSLSDEEKEKFDPVRCMLVDELVTTYLDPQPPVPMDIAIIVDENNGPGKK